MAGETGRRRRPHAAASSRILAAGVSSATALSIMAALAVTPGTEPPAAPVAAPALAPPEVVVVRRHWIEVPSGPATPAPPTRSVAASHPAPQPPVARSRGS